MVSKLNVKYLEDINVDALRHLRRAVSDTFLADNRPQSMLLGGYVSTEDVVDKVSTVRWDMVFAFFKDAIPWYLLPCLYLTFSDWAHMSKLLLLGRYGKDKYWHQKERPVHDASSAHTYASFRLPRDHVIPSAEGHCRRQPFH